jgi:hypothetical protein
LSVENQLDDFPLISNPKMVVDALKSALSVAKKLSNWDRANDQAAFATLNSLIAA